MEELQQFLLYVDKRVREHSAGVDALSLMHDKGRDAQRADRQPRLLIRALRVIVHKPIDRGVNGEIYLGVLDRCDLRQNNRGAVRLHGRAIVESVDIVEKNLYRNLLIRIISRHINADE